MKNYSFINRELSWIEFNQRVQDEISGHRSLLFESLKFTSIVCSNLDEFFMVRVASIRDQIQAGLETGDPSGLETTEIMNRIAARAHTMTDELYKKYKFSLLKDLKKENILLIKPKDIEQDQRRYLDDYFEKNVFPVLTPMVVDRGRPFPLLLNKSLNIALILANDEHSEDSYFATIQVPSVLERLITLPSNGDRMKYVFLEDLIKMNLERIFSGYKIQANACYRITRNADLSINEEGAEDLLEEIEESIKQRRWGAVIRLEIEKEADPQILDRLVRALEVDSQQIYLISGPIDLKFLKQIYSLDGYERLLYPPIEPRIYTHDGLSLFEAIRKNDLLLHHPYDSFQTVIEFIHEAAEDPQVLAIKQTLYRVSDNSPIIEALVRAAENGKQVTVLIEIKARFDEQNNIQWAKRLEKAGCHVIYGLAGLKTHCKVLLIVRKEEDGIIRYVHLSTGNYNELTACLYTDIGLLTANPYFGADASNLFNMLSGLSKPLDMFQLIIAPYNLREKIMQLIQKEKKIAEAGKKAKIIIKINSLVDKDIITALYEAAQAGVSVKLIVRGICCLVPNFPGVSENITVVSIVGRFLEHSRIYYFFNDGVESIYLSSADLMERNLNRRVEVLFPITDELLKTRVKRILDITMRDNAQTKKMMPDGTYKKLHYGKKKPISCQEMFQRESLEPKNIID